MGTIMKPDQTKRVAFALYDTARLLRKTIDQKVRGIGMSHAQWAILAAVARSDGPRQVDLASEMDLEPITVARMIDRLEAAGLVERRADPGDRRARRLYLKPDATPTLHSLKALGEEMMAEAMAGISKDDIDTAVGVLERMRCNFQAVHAGGNSAGEDRLDQIGGGTPATSTTAKSKLQHVG
jgi:DNA-binding MarR family transcriptional regulator